MRKFMSVLLSAAMVLTAVPVSVAVLPVVEVSADETTEYADATQYTYKITPILAPFEYYIYVETDNPDPYSFAFADYDSVYVEDEDDTTVYDMAVYALKETRFVDVEYESDDSYRVNGGYIFYCQDGESDGGELTLLQTTGEAGTVTTLYWGSGGYGSTMYYDYEDTGITVTASAMVDYLDYLIDTYTTEDQTFFEKMDAVQEGLESIAVYPRDVYDSDKPTGYYPALACSAYSELSLNEHYEIICEEADGMLLSYVYPFVLDSASFPGTMSAIATKLEPSAEVSSTDVHYMITVTFDGESGSYGGAGAGGYDPLYSEHVGKLYTFDDSTADFSSGKTIEDYFSQLLSYGTVAAEDAEYYRDLIAGDTFTNTIIATGGTWIRAAREGYSIGYSTYAYLVPTAIYDTICVVSEAWVDGRYIDKWEHVEDATFDEYPTADIVVTDMTYTDAYGDVHTQDVIYEYDSDTETWIAGWGFTGYWDIDSMPDEFILTADEVADMNVDSKNGITPESGLIYDGTAFPGTEFVYSLATKVDVPDKVEVVEDKSVTVDYVLTPEDATFTYVTCTSADSSIASAGIDYYTGDLKVYGESVGTTTITVISEDGACQTTMEVTVTARDTSEDYIYEQIDSKSVALVDYNGSDKNITIPSETDGCSVTEIGYEAFYNQGDIYSIKVPEGVTTADEEAFRNCNSLQSITLPDSLTYIGKAAFIDCMNLPEVNLPDNITYIGEYAFCFCINLDNVILPSKLTSISEGTFLDCVCMTNITIPASVTSIGDYAFYYCSDLTDVYFKGTEEQWNAITIGEGNSWLTSATIHFVDYELGDVNEDGYINYLDAMSVLRYDAELITLTDAQLLAGDVNGDGKVNSLDAILILRRDAGLIDSFE